MTRAQVIARRERKRIEFEAAGREPVRVLSSPTKGSVFGRRGMPLSWVVQMYCDYLENRSLSITGNLHGRSRQSVFELFKSHKLKMYPRWKTKHPVTIYGGRTFTPGKNGYLRDTKARGRRQRTDGLETQLQRQVWADVHGPIPPGHEVILIDGNKNNCAIENLKCLPRAEAHAARASGENQFTRAAKSNFNLLVKNFSSGKRTLATELKR